MRRSKANAQREVEAEIAQMFGWHEIPSELKALPAIQARLRGAVSQLIEMYPDADEAIDFDEVDALTDVYKEVSKNLAKRWHQIPAQGNPSENAESLGPVKELDRAEPPPASRVAVSVWEQKKARKAAEAQSQFLEWKCNQDQSVQDFRRRVFGTEGGVDLVRGVLFLTSPLAKVLSVELYSSLHQVPLEANGSLKVRTGKKWRSVSPGEPLLFQSGASRRFMERKRLPERAEFLAEIIHSISPQPGAFEFWSHLLVLPTSSYVGVHWPSSLHYGDAANADAVFHFTPQHLPAPAYIPFLDETRYLEGMKGSVAAEALAVCERLTAICPIDVWEALKFLVTGHLSIPTMSGGLFVYAFPPTSERSSRGHSAFGLARLEFQPWLTPKDVADYWKVIRASQHNGIAHQLPTEGDIDLFRFMLAHTTHGQPFRWKQLWGEWRKAQGDAGHPVQKIPHNPSDRMRKVFYAVRNALFPGYKE